MKLLHDAVDSKYFSVELRRGAPPYAWPRRGRLAMRTTLSGTCSSWSETGRRIAYNPDWMKEASEDPSGYLRPLPDFASHSPFCGASWFQLDAVPRESE